MITRTFSSLVVAGLIGTAAQAADLRGTFPAVPMPVEMVPAFSWTGLHVGGFGAYADLEDHGMIRNQVDTKSYSFKREDDGALGGGTIGYDVQVGATPVVLGIEADAAAGSLVARGPTTLSVSKTQVFSTNEDDVDVLATLRARAGYAFGPALLYATGGLAIRHGETRHTQYYTPTFDIPFSSTPFATDRTHDTSVGYVVGAGLEYAFADHWSVKGEYNYMRFDDLVADYPRGLQSVEDATVVAPRRATGSERINLAKLGVNYRF